MKILITSGWPSPISAASIHTWPFVPPWRVAVAARLMVPATPSSNPLMPIPSF